jgi:hypothetical protein
MGLDDKIAEQGKLVGFKRDRRNPRPVERADQGHVTDRGEAAERHDVARLQAVLPKASLRRKDSAP